MDNEKNNITEGGNGDVGLNIGITYRKSLYVQKYNVIVLTILFLIALGLAMYSFSQDNVVWTYVGTHFFIPWIIVTAIQLFCTLYSIFAWTRTSMRYVYVDVFYVTVFSKLVSIFYCVYMLVMIFVPHHFFISNKMEVITFDIGYLIVAGVVFSYVLLDDVVCISFIAGLYFKLDKFIKTLTKYSWIRDVCYIFIDALIAGYYVYSLITYGYVQYKITLLGICIGSAIANAFVLYKKVCKPQTFKMKNLEEMEPPKDFKIQTAFKIIKMKDDVRSIANTAAACA